MTPSDHRSPNDVTVGNRYDSPGATSAGSDSGSQSISVPLSCATVMAIELPLGIVAVVTNQAVTAPFRYSSCTTPGACATAVACAARRCVPRAPVFASDDGLTTRRTCCAAGAVGIINRIQTATRISLILPLKLIP